MLSTVVLPYAHVLAALVMTGAAMVQLYLLKLAPARGPLRLLGRVDRVYGLTAGLVLVTGGLRATVGDKGLDYYLGNWGFHAAVGLFVLAALISLVPTVRFLRWNRLAEVSGALPDLRAWDATRRLVHLQLGLIALILLFMTLTARGYAAIP